MWFTIRPRFAAFLAAGSVQVAIAALTAAAVLVVPERSALAGASPGATIDPAAKDAQPFDAAIGTWRNPEIGVQTPEPGDDPPATQEGAVLPPPVVVPMTSPSPVSPFVLPLAAWDAVTDRFGVPRGEDHVHGGIDLALDSYPRSAILAACAGTVSVASNNATYGNYVMVNCGGGWSTLYGHLSELLVEVGEVVPAGGILGASGSTGFSTGEHLHFEIRYLGVPLEPEDYLDFNIDPNQPRSSGPIRIPATETETPTPTPTATATDAVPSPSPEPSETVESTPTPAPLVPDPEDYFSVVIQAGEDAARGNTVALPSDDPESFASAVVLAVNQFEAEASSPPAIVELAPACADCAPVGVLVQVNLFLGNGQSRPDAAVAVIDRANCDGADGCRGLAYVLQVDIPLDSAKEVDSPRMRDFLAALATELRALGLQIDDGTIHRELIEARLGDVLALFPEYAGLVNAAATVAPEGAFLPPPEPEAATAEPTTEP